MLHPMFPIVDAIADSQMQLTRLEWMWGMQYDSLELEIEANRIYRTLYCYPRPNGH